MRLLHKIREQPKLLPKQAGLEPPKEQSYKKSKKSLAINTESQKRDGFFYNNTHRATKRNPARNNER